MQGVGFRPFVFRIAHEQGVRGWVLNDADGVRIHAEAGDAALAAFNHSLVNEAPPAARIESIEIHPIDVVGHEAFLISDSEQGDSPTAGISPDLPVCDDKTRLR